jgi:uncharacterized membrane protein required for colicin V production
MSIFLVLDILLILLIALFTPIGFWRGPVKELLVSLGVLFGILLADYWARPWGRDLSDVSDLTDGSGAFIVAMTFLVASTFILGYGAGAALGPSIHSTQARLIGAAVAALNGMLLLSFALQYVRLYLLSDSNEESLEDSYVAQFLLDQIGWVLLGAALAAVPLLLYILISGRRAYEVIYDDYDWDAAYVPVQAAAYERARVANPQASTLPPRVPGPPDDRAAAVYKAEPEPMQRRASAETRPLVIAEQLATAEPRPDSASDDDLRDRFGDTDPHIVIPAGAGTQPAGESDDNQPAPEPAEPPVSDLAPGYERCHTCHAVLPPDATICPNCGTLR